MLLIPAARQTALKAVGAQIGIAAVKQPNIKVNGFRLSQDLYRFWKELAQVHRISLSAAMAQMAEAYLECHDDSFQPTTGGVAPLAARTNQITLPCHLEADLRDRCKTNRVHRSDCMRQVVAWAASLID